MDKSNQIERYIQYGNHDYIVRSKDLRQYLKQGEENPEINYRCMEESAEGLFQNRPGLPLAEYIEITKKFYQTLDLESRGIPSILLDTQLLLNYFTRAVDYVSKKTTKKSRTNRALVIGCGTGRLAEMYIEMAKKLRLKGITFNDLIEEHVEKTKHKLQTVYNVGSGSSYRMNIDGIEVKFVTGDFTDVNLEDMRYDISTAIWFVTSEVLDPSSPENLRKRRIQFFTKVRDALIDKGVFIEDIPDSGLPGFYLLSRMKTLDILKRKKILPTEEGNLSLTNIQKKSGGYPYHIRYLPNGTHEMEMRLTGLYSMDQISADIPTEAIITAEPDYLALFKEKKIRDVIGRVNRMITDLVKIPDQVPIDQKKKKIILWTPSRD